MNLHEYQAKELFEEAGITISEYEIVTSVSEAKEVLKRTGWQEVVLKIQVHAGGRGKAGGVRFAKGEKEILEIVDTLLGMKMVNKQTGPEGIIANKVMMAPPVSIEKEYYLSALIDRKKAQGVLIACAEGGMDIEEVAEKTPEKILTLPILPCGTLRPYQLVRLCKHMGWGKEISKQARVLIQALAHCFVQTDASLVEINPLVLTKEGVLLALDAKLSVDDNALFRHPQIASYYDPSQDSEQEIAAKRVDLAYIACAGEIGCMVNGAGLAMATMDIIQLYGKEPANFLDVGGSASKEKIAEGLRIILSDPKVKVILINIFGGIMNCATLSQGVVEAAKEQKITAPLVVRLEGTNVEEGRAIFERSDLEITFAEDLDSAAKLAVEKV